MVGGQEGRKSIRRTRADVERSRLWHRSGSWQLPAYVIRIASLRSVEFDPGRLAAEYQVVPPAAECPVVAPA